MGKLNERYTAVMKKAISAMMPMIDSITSNGFDDPSTKLYTDLTLESVALGGDLMQAIDDLQENQKLLKEQLDRLDRKTEREYELMKYIDDRLDGLEAMILEPEKFKKAKQKKEEN